MCVYFVFTLSYTHMYYLHIYDHVHILLKLKDCFVLWVEATPTMPAVSNRLSRCLYDYTCNYVLNEVL